MNIMRVVLFHVSGEGAALISLGMARPAL